MRLLFVLTALLLFVAPAQAGDRPHHGHGYHSSWDDVAPDGPHGQGDIDIAPRYQRYYDPFYWGRDYYRGYQRDGLSLRYNDGDWSASLNFGGRDHYRNQYRPGRGHSYGCECYDCQNYYGYDYGYNNRVYYSPDGVSVRYFGQPDYADYYYRNIRPVDQYYRDQQDYYNQRYYNDQGYSSDYGQQDPQTVNIYNNYYTGEGTQAGVNGPDPNPPSRFEELPPVLPPPDTVQGQAGDIPWGRQFYSSAVFETSTFTYNASLSEGKLVIGPEVGPGQVIAEGIDSSLGVLATYHPREGIVFVFVSNGKLAAAYESVSGWDTEVLPIDIDFSEDVSLGNMGGYPWVVFNDRSGTRYVYSYSTAGWQAVGSGSPAPPED